MKCIYKSHLYLTIIQISEIRPGVGFSKFNAETQLEAVKNVGIKTLMRVIGPRKEKIGKTMTDPSTREKFFQAWDDFMLMMKGEEEEEGADSFQTSTVKFIYQDGTGGFMMLGLAFARVGPPEKKRYNFDSYLVKGEFTLAPTMIIRHNVKKSIGKSQSWDSIDYVPTHLTDEKAKDIIDRMLPTLAMGTLQLMNSVQPLAIKNKEL